MARTPDTSDSAAGAWQRPMPQGGADMGGLLDRMTGEIQARIADLERRHADALQAMQSKLERMSGEAVKARPAMPLELSTAFGRIEAGMADLVERIAETVPERRRGAEAFVFGTPKAEHSHFVFNPPQRVPVAPVALDTVDAGEPWDNSAAEALARMYESGVADVAKHLPEAALFAPGRWAREAAAQQQAGHVPAVVQPVQVAPIAPPAPVVAGLGEDRDWLDQRFAVISDHISKTVRDARPIGAIDALTERVDQFEQRFTSTLSGVAGKVDQSALRPDALAQVEDQIKDLAGRIESTHRELSRLDQIEQHLADLTEFAHASIDATPAPADTTVVDSPAVPDLAALADMAVERALARMPAAPVAQAAADPAEAHARINAIQTALQEFSAERRRGEQNTSEVLETMQEALIRLIERLDDIDAGITQSRTQATVAPPVEILKAAAAAQSPPAPTSAGIDVKSLKTIRRRELRPMAVADAAVADSADARESDGAAPARPEISINDLRLNIGRPGKPANADATARPAEAGNPTAAARGARAAIAKAQTSPNSSGKRGMVVGAAALSLVGISYVASLLFEDRFGAPASGSAANAPPVPVKGPTPALPVTATARPAAPAVPAATASGLPGLAGPPGLVGTPVRPEAATSTSRPQSQLQPSNPSPAQPTGTAPTAPGVRAGAAPAPVAAPNLEFTPTRPASVPETVNDDLSAADIDERGMPSEPARPIPVAGLTAKPAVTPLAQFQGMALAVPAAPTQFSEIAAARRQAQMAVASERAISQAPTADTFSQRFDSGTAAPAAPAAKGTRGPVVAASSIVTGSTPAPRVQSMAKLGTGETAEPGATAIELPPALVGPLSLRLAASKGDASASFEVATRFAEGRGIKQDFKQAMTWYQRSAAKGLAVAQYRLGTLYERGLGTPIDVAQARMWYKQSAEQGNVKAMHNLAVLSAGNGQNAPDYDTASKWFGAASAFGLADSQFNLAVLYENGLGVTKDPALAYSWYAIAARNGDAEATRRRDKLLGTLDVTTLQSADERVRNYHSRPIDQKINDARVAGDQWRSQTAQVQGQ